jgi:hypothetical protein
MTETSDGPQCECGRRIPRGLSAAAQCDRCRKEQGGQRR